MVALGQKRLVLPTGGALTAYYFSDLWRTMWNFSIYGMVLGGIQGQPHAMADAGFGLSIPISAG
ncbi:hypothetical protein CXP34_05705 [Ralstonia mannitolilytica]|nr:hypothetical protein CXP34_05705 [Ralstonia mannitolilytica]